MTVSTTLNKIIYSGNGATTVFPFAFASPAVPSDIQVFFTDTLGNVTLLSPSVYTLVFNAATGTNPTPVGGSVTYNPGGIPIPTGTFLTILRNLPLTQATSLANQQTSYQQVTEQALDYDMMVNQQILEVQSRALIVSISDPTPNPLPAVAARAGLILGFDVNGNPVALSSLPAGTVSSAMAPVVNAATLATARSALGLGNIAVETIGLGLEDNGAGSLQTFFQSVADSSSPQTVTSSFHQSVHAATGAITYNFPRANTLFNGFGFWIYALTGAVTLAINAADVFSGGVTGASLVIPVGSRVFVSTDAQASGTWYVRGVNFASFNAPLNLQINTSVASSALTIALKDANGNDPSAASPVFFVTSTGGFLNPRAVTGPLSITVPSGATLGTLNGTQCRIWIALFDNAGTPVLGVYNSLSASLVSSSYSIQPWDETTAVSTTGISAGSTSAQTWYTSSALTTKSFRIIGYLEATEPTAGTWSTGANKIQLMGPGVKKPGEVVQEQSTTFTATATVNSTTFALFSASQAQAITLNSLANLIRAEASGSINLVTGALSQLQLSIGGISGSGLFGNIYANPNAVGGAANFGFYCRGVTLPNLPGSLTVALQGKSGSAGVQTTVVPVEITVKEIQI